GGKPSVPSRWGRPARPSSAGAPGSPFLRPALDSAKEARAPARGLLLPLRLAVRSSVGGPGAACDSSSTRKMQSPRSLEPLSGPRILAGVSQRHRGLGAIPCVRQGCLARTRNPGPSAGSRWSQAEASRGPRSAPRFAGRHVPNYPPFWPFLSAHNKCVHYRTHHLPSQIPRADGQADSRPRGHTGRPVPAPPACLLGTPECAPPGCAQRVWMDMRVCQCMVTEQARALVCMRVCQTSVLQESALVQAHAHTRGGHVCCECLETERAEMRLFGGAQRKGCYT
ncbi:hypothetical protein HPG69_014821, partial [Diceros bicornis minor]